MGLLLFLMRASRRAVLAATLVGVLSGVASVALVAMIHQILRAPGVDVPYALWIFGGLCALILATRILSQSMLTKLSQHSVSRLTRHLCERVLDAPLRHVENLGTGRIYATLTTDVMVIAHALNALPAVFVSATIMAAGILYLGWLSPGAFAATVALLVLGVASYRVTSKSAQRRFQDGRIHLDALMAHIDSLINGVKELKVNAARRRAYMDELLGPADARVREQQIAGFTIQNTAATLGRLQFFVAIGVILFAGPAVFALDRATLVAYVLVILYLAAPLERVMACLPLMSRARVALRRIEDMRLTLDQGEGLGTASVPSPDWQRVELQDVRFVYGTDIDTPSFHLGPINLALAPGELVFVVGGNGSGKTTLAKLLTGLYVPDDGRILIDGTLVTEANREAYRQLFSMVFADTPLFERIIGLDPDRVAAHAQGYLEMLDIDKKVAIRDGAFSTVDLSRGQRKRLALLGALLEDRPIYILDEWAADQDPVFRRVFYRVLLPDLRARGKTAVVISHDDRYFDVADRLITLEEGRVREHVRRPAVSAEPVLLESG